MYVKSIYWKLEILSCVLVLRNRNWFEITHKKTNKYYLVIKSLISFSGIRPSNITASPDLQNNVIVE